MKHQNRISEPCELLDENGLLVNPGYATRPFWRYDREKIKAGWHRIKEWDYYYILSADRGYGITFTVADLGYMGMAAICWLDFRQQTFQQLDALSILPMGKLNLPSTSDEGVTKFMNKKMDLRFEVSGEKRLLVFDAPGFVASNGEKGLSGQLELIQKSEMDSMAIATSWKENPRAFYYNHKVNCMPVKGTIALGDSKLDFTPETSFAGLDWGRGYWTYKNRWYWGSASGLLEGELFGWNIGYGFSDRSVATENMIFYKGQAHKLDEVVFHMNTGDYMEPWTFTSNDGRFEMSFQPLVDRQSAVNFRLIKSIQHQVFGTFSGSVILDDGTVLRVNEFLGFAEDVLNWW